MNLKSKPSYILVIYVVLVSLNSCNRVNNISLGNLTEKSQSHDSKPAIPDSNYIIIINDVLKANFTDSVQNAKYYHPEYTVYPDDYEEYNEKEIRVETNTYKGDNYIFIFFTYAEGYTEILKNHEVIFVNTSFPSLPNPSKIKFNR